VAVILKRSLPPGMHSADGKAGIGISFGTDMEGYQIIQSLAPQGSAAMSDQVRSSCAARAHAVHDFVPCFHFFSSCCPAHSIHRMIAVDCRLPLHVPSCLRCSTDDMMVANRFVLEISSSW